MEDLSSLFSFGLLVMAIAMVVGAWFLLERLLGWLLGLIGSGFAALFGWTMGAKPIGLPADEEEALREDAKAYVHDPRLLIVACLGKFAKVDGVVTKREIKVVEEVFGDMELSNEERRQAVNTFNHAKQGRATLRSCVLLYAELQQHDAIRVHSLLYAFFRVAHADDTPSPRTQQTLEKICQWVSMDYRECAKLYGDARQDTPPPLDTTIAAYAVLGCQPGDALSVVKDRYRKLAKDFHPDTIIGKNLAPDFVRFAEERFKQIQAAYETVMAARGPKAT